MKDAKIISLANQKGGVGKTTSTINLGVAYAIRGHRTLIIDLDPQGNTSTGLGVSVEKRHVTTYDLLFGNYTDHLPVTRLEVDNLMIVPASMDLSSADAELSAVENRIYRLGERLKYLKKEYTYILIDCPPSLTLLTLNALVASKSVLVPLQAEFFAMEGLSQLLLTIREIRMEANKALRIEGIFMTMFDRRNGLCHQVEKEAREYLGDLVLKTKIPRNVRLSEAPSFGMPIQNYDPNSRGAVAYRSLASELLHREAARAKPNE